jgi:hypothetical protein
MTCWWKHMWGKWTHYDFANQKFEGRITRRFEVLKRTCNRCGEVQYKDVYIAGVA